MGLLKHIVWLLASMLFANLAAAQISLERVVIGSAGSFSEAGPVHLSSTVGEAAISTQNFTDFWLTQGFQQPRVASELTLAVTVVGQNATCLNSDDGTATATVAGGTPPYTYSWDNATPNQDGDTTASAVNLALGDYSVLVTDAEGQIGIGFATIDADLFENCGLEVFNGLTPNGDKFNDSWVIQHIEDWPNNNVQIYSRWGDLVWETTSYHNETNYWEGVEMGGMALPEGTYFYLISYNNQVKKG